MVRDTICPGCSEAPSRCKCPGGYYMGRPDPKALAELLAYGEVMMQDGKLVPRHLWRVDRVPAAAERTKGE